MADGAVKLFYDETEDGYLNPGFPIPTGLTEYTNVGYNSPTVELAPANMYNGIWINDSYFKGTFEE